MTTFSIFTFKSVGEAATTLEWLLWLGIHGPSCLALAFTIEGAGEAAATTERHLLCLILLGLGLNCRRINLGWIFNSWLLASSFLTQLSLSCGC